MSVCPKWAGFRECPLEDANVKDMAIHV